jgi:hypothetical protein
LNDARIDFLNRCHNKLQVFIDYGVSILPAGFIVKILNSHLLHGQVSQSMQPC